MTADQRIEALLKRAGCPMMIVHSDAPATEERHMAYLIDRLEVALENVLNERDALMRDLPAARCGICVHCYDEVCCDVPMDERGDWLGPCKAFAWRGVPDQEDAHE